MSRKPNAKAARSSQKRANPKNNNNNKMPQSAKLNTNLKRNPLQSVPVAQGRVSSVGNPIINSLAAGGDARIRVRHKEYLQDIVGLGAGFSTTQIAIQPALLSSFPWLSSLAKNYESYQFERLSFLYETTSASSSSGSIILAVDYDAADLAPTTKVEAMNMHGAVRSNPWQECCHRSTSQDLKKFGPQRYTRETSLLATEDVKTYDIGNLFLCLDGVTASTVGELYVEYDVTLMTPQLSANQASLSAKITGNAGTGASRLLVFGTAPLGTNANFAAVNNTITFNRVGSYLVDVSTDGTVFTGADYVTTGSTAAIAIVDNQITNGAVTSAGISYTANVTIPGQTLQFNLTSAGSVTTMVARIAPYLLSLA